MASPAGWTLQVLLLLAASGQAKPFAYTGISLRSDLMAVAARHPNSTLQGDYLRLAPEDMQDHISAVAISGTGAARRVRIMFEVQRPNGPPDYPRCRDIEARLTGDFGAPHAIRRFSEEASPRADRIWRSGTEELTLICFKGARGVYRAEAVQIAPR
ncbi:MAG TPA: hypothetical protein VFM14_18465 [Gemmatimonadales bacterium]|nr:hypothetical protein [Gemmatimonadales bacterium]